MSQIDKITFMVTVIWTIIIFSAFYSLIWHRCLLLGYEILRYRSNFIYEVISYSYQIFSISLIFFLIFKNLLLQIFSFKLGSFLTSISFSRFLIKYYNILNK